MGEEIEREAQMGVLGVPLKSRTLAGFWSQGKWLKSWELVGVF